MNITIDKETFDDILHVLRKTRDTIDEPIGDLLTGDSMADTGAYDCINMIDGMLIKLEDIRHPNRQPKNKDGLKTLGDTLREVESLWKTEE